MGYCRVVDDGTGAELCRFSLRDAGSETGLIVSKIAREAGERWGFHALGLPSHGSMYKDCLPHIQRICHDDTRKLMARGGTADWPNACDTGGATSERPRVDAVAPGPTADCCVVM